jgi:hypothetical protein
MRTEAQRAAREETMIRRNLYYIERDQRVVKWALIAAAFALSLGYFAETALIRNDADATVAGESVEAQSDDAARAAG